MEINVLVLTAYCTQSLNGENNVSILPPNFVTLTNQLTRCAALYDARFVKCAHHAFCNLQLPLTPISALDSVEVYVYLQRSIIPR